MAKQPYIPFYIGDYIKDTRKLPLAVRGAWVDLLLFMWDEEVRGEISGSFQEFAGMLSCTLEECKFAIDLLTQKKICDYANLPDGKIKLISRRMKKDHALSVKRSRSGQAGNIAKKLRKLKNDICDRKTDANSDIEYINEDDTENRDRGVGERDESWPTMPGEDQFGLLLPEVKIGAVIELIGLTQRQMVSREQVLSLWDIFKKQNFTGKKYYHSEQDAFSHFFNWSKLQNLQNGANSKSNAGGRGANGRSILKADLEADIRATAARTGGNIG